MRALVVYAYNFPFSVKKIYLYIYSVKSCLLKGTIEVLAHPNHSKLKKVLRQELVTLIHGWMWHIL